MNYDKIGLRSGEVYFLLYDIIGLQMVYTLNIILNTDY